MSIRWRSILFAASAALALTVVTPLAGVGAVGSDADFPRFALPFAAGNAGSAGIHGAETKEDMNAIDFNP